MLPIKTQSTAQLVNFIRCASSRIMKIVFELGIGVDSIAYYHFSLLGAQMTWRLASYVLPLISTDGIVALLCSQPVMRHCWLLHRSAANGMFLPFCLLTFQKPSLSLAILHPHVIERKNHSAGKAIFLSLLFVFRRRSQSCLLALYDFRNIQLVNLFLNSTLMLFLCYYYF